MVQAILNKERIATVAGDITAFSYDRETREYLSSSIEYLAVGVGIPAASCIEKPGDSKAGYAICRNADFTDWEYVVDHRGETVFSTETGEAVIVSLPGDYPVGTTALAPSTSYDTWNGSEWVTDTEAQQAADVAAAERKKTALLAKAQGTISIWQTELQLGIISDEDKASLLAWMNYIKAVQAVDTSTASDISWPVKAEA